MKCAECFREVGVAFEVVGDDLDYRWIDVASLENTTRGDSLESPDLGHCMGFEFYDTAPTYLCAACKVGEELKSGAYGPTRFSFAPPRMLPLSYINDMLKEVYVSRMREQVHRPTRIWQMLKGEIGAEE